jgi:endonuclease YncB( thermonuclease family)
MPRLTLTAAAALLISAQAQAAEWPAYAGTVVSVHDGDTLTVEARIWPGVVARDAVRVQGLDTPELRGKCPAERQAAQQAKELTARLAPTGGPVTLQVKGRDKYGRLLARVVLPDGRDLAAVLIEAGLARPYDGGARAGWCRKDEPQRQ